MSDTDTDTDTTRTRVLIRLSVAEEILVAVPRLDARVEAHVDDALLALWRAKRCLATPHPPSATDPENPRR